MRSLNNPLIIICLIILDLVLIVNIYQNKTGSSVLGVSTFKTTQKKVPARIIKITKTRPTISPRPTKAPAQAQPTPSPTPVVEVVKTITQNPTSSPTSVPQVVSDDISSQLLKQVNDFRASVGLSAVTTDSNTCGFANTRASEITGSFSHDGFNNRVSSHGLPYPSYSYVNENIAMNSDPNQVVAMWIASPGHNENMRKDTPYVCIAKSGDYYAYEGWKP